MPQQPLTTAQLKALAAEAEAEVAGVTAPTVSETPSAGSRFASSLWQNIDPIAGLKGLWQIGRHPIDTATGIAATSLDQYRQAKAAQAERLATQPDRWLPTGPEFAHSLGAIPLIGPALMEVADKTSAGDYAGAAGSAAGLAVPYTRPLKTAGRVAQGTARLVAPKGAANVLSKLAQNKVVEVIAPQVGSNKTRIGRDAAKVAQNLLDRGLTDKWSREGVHAAVNDALDVAGKKLDAAADARATWKDFDTEELVAALEAKKKEIQANPIEASKFPRRVDEETNLPVTEPYGKASHGPAVTPRLKQINAAIAELRELGPSVRYEAVKRIRQHFDVEAKPAYSPTVTADYVKNLSKQSGAADVTGALREFLASKDPATAAANTDWSILKRAKSVLDATEETERVRPKTGRKIMSRVAGSIAGSEVAGLMGAIIGFALAPAADVSIGMGVTTKLKLNANVLDRLAKAIRSGSPQAVDFYAGQVKRTLLQAGVLQDRAAEGMTRPYEMPPQTQSTAIESLDGVWDMLPSGELVRVK